MCGKEDDLLLVLVEEVEMNLCRNCSKFGKTLNPTKKISKTDHPKKIEEEYVEGTIENFSEIIKNKREKLGLSQKELARSLNEKESIVHKIETGHIEPNLDLARKIERFLGIKILKEYSVRYKKISSENKSFTIGDIIGNKKRTE